MSTLKYFSKNKEPKEVEFDPIDLFLEVSMESMSNKDITKFLSTLTEDQLDEIKSELPKWNTKPSSSDEYAIVEGAKKVKKLLKGFSIANRINSLNKRITNFTHRG